ncbi:MAG: metallophosphoesterase family protein [Porphyromonas sp.]|nr:metallophosphoesterase family protein [Porphyromonas sp.]
MMGKKILGLIVLFCCLWSLQSSAQEGKVQMPMGKDGTFKIVQFTDIHYEPLKPESAESIETMKKVLEAEQPDLIIYTGDIVVGAPIADAIQAVFSIPEEMGIPFAFTFGNHDDEHDMDKEAIYSALQSFKQNITTRTEGISGVTNYIIELTASDQKELPQALLYVFDSHAYSGVEGLDGYDWIKSDQVQWYERESRAYTQKNGGQPIPALAYFHIPLPEYNYAAGSDKYRLYGSRMEAPCAPLINTGLAASMILNGDVMATFVGHDHINDFLVSYHGLVLAYGRFTGGATTYNDVVGGGGARVVQLKAGEHSFRTWIRLSTGEVVKPYDTSAPYHK